MTSYLSETNVQLGATYPIGVKSTTSYEAGMQSAATYINTIRDSIVLGSSTTQLFRNLSMALYNHLTPGSEIIISTLDHEANIAAWVQLATLRSVAIKWWHPDTSTSNPQLTPSSLQPLLSEKTKLVSCTHTSNILGTIHPVRPIADLVHTIPSALLVVDAVAFAPHRAVDVQALGVDFYAFSWYKVYGPHISMLYASSRGRASLMSLGHYFKPARTLEDVLGLAGASYELVSGIPSVVRYLESLADEKSTASLGDKPLLEQAKSAVGLAGADEDASHGATHGFETLRQRLGRAWERIALHEEKLQAVLLEYLGSAPHGKKVTVWGEPGPEKTKRVPVISFTVEGWGSKDLVQTVLERCGGRFGFRWGAFYSNRLVSDVLGIKDVDDGVVRVSLVHYNTVEEVRGFVEVLDEVLKGVK